MNNDLPEPPGKGSITISCDEHGTAVEYSEMPPYVLAHLFYVAMIEIPDAYLAATVAINKYKKETP